MNQIDLRDILSKINIKADWIGLREVKESTTYRIIRDLKPESNNIQTEIKDKKEKVKKEIKADVSKKKEKIKAVKKISKSIISKVKSLGIKKPKE